MSSSSTARPAVAALSTRQRLLDAATKVFLAHGFTAASMDMVRQEAGVSNGSLYHHFPTKTQLADALYAHTLRDFHAALMVPIGGKASAQAGVKGLVRAYIQWVLQHPTQARLLHALRRGGDMAEGTETSTANEDAFSTLKAWMEQRMEAGEMRVMPFHLWMALLFSPAMSLTQRWVSQPTPAVAPKVRAALEHAAWMAVAP
jgi:AcrR family transcriptional regulator